MPCSKCEIPLLVVHDLEGLYCPNCHDIEVVDPTEIEEKIEKARTRVNEDRVMELVQEYDKNHLILLLIDELNRVSHAFYDNLETGLPAQEFSYISYLLKLIYKRDGFGDKEFEYQEQELPEEIETLLEWIDKLIRSIEQVEGGFRYAVEPPVPPHNPQPFVGEYLFYDSEYRYCFQRCLRSLIGGSEEDMEFFFKTHEEARSFDRTDVDEIDSLEDFTSTFFELIVTMAFMLSTDDTLNEIYYTTLPDAVDVFDLKDFMDCIDSQFSDEGIAVIDEKGTLPVADQSEVENCGEDIFGGNWEEVKRKLIVSEDNFDAHPFLFKIIREKVVSKPTGRPPITVDSPEILYPRYYNLLARFQLFPMLENGGSKSGIELLDDECENRGRQFERNLYEYLEGNGYECFHSSWFTKSDQREIDLIVVNQDEGELWFVECKFFLPETHMRTANGIVRLNQKFDSKVFKKDTENYDAESGEPFPEKVERWLDEKPGEAFLSHVGSDGDERVEQLFEEDWTSLETRMFVVSNVVPSYIEKKGVEFLTDLEFIEMVEGKSELYTKKA